MFKITFNKSFRFSLNNSTLATLIMPWLFGFTYNWCNNALKKQSPAPPTSRAFIPNWCNLSSKMLIAGGLTTSFFSNVLTDLGSTPHQQMDLTADPVYRRRYKFSQLTPFGSRNHDDDGNKNLTNLQIWQWKTIVLHALHVQFSFLTFRRRSHSFYDAKRPVLQLCGRRDHMMTNVQFCLLIYWSAGCNLIPS